VSNADLPVEVGMNPFKDLDGKDQWMHRIQQILDLECKAKYK